MGVLTELRREKNPYLERYECKTCGKIFWRRTKKSNSNKKAIGVRGLGFQTCSKRCSAQYCYTL